MNSTPPTTDSLLRFWQPRYWPIWIGYGLLRLLVLLPYPLLRRTGHGLGHLARLLIRSRRRIVAANLRLCFPELGEREREKLLRRHFASLGLQVVELGLAGFASDRRVMRLTRIEGVEHLRRATAGGKGAILLSGHMATTEFAGRRLWIEAPGAAAVYRTNKNPLIDAIIQRCRRHSVSAMISKDGMRQMIRTLNSGVSVWYASDQSYRRRYSVLVPFFGEPAMTNGALTHIARISGAPVVPFFSRRLPDGKGYLISIEPALENFPSGDMAADATRVNEILERRIRMAPEEYYWIHRRFKGRPAGYPDPYADA